MKIEPLSPCNKQLGNFDLYAILLKLVYKYLLSSHPRLTQLICDFIESSCSYLFKNPNQIPHVPPDQMLQLKAVLCLNKPEIFVVAT